MATADLSLDTIYELLSEPRRRYILYYFLDEEQATVEDLSVRIATREGKGPRDEVSETEIQQVMTSVVHSHVPKLENHGLVERDRQTDDVVVTARFDDIRDTVSRAESSETEGKNANSTRDSGANDPLPQSSNDDARE